MKKGIKDHILSRIGLIEKEEAEAVAAAAVRAAEHESDWGWNAAVRYVMNVADTNGFHRSVGRRLYCLARRLQREKEAQREEAQIHK